MRVGFAGLGRMGRHMAENLLKAGHELTVWNRSLGTAEAFAREVGGLVASTPRDLAERSEAVVTMLADDASSEAVHFGEDGLFAATGARVFLEMGTMSPDHIAALAAAAPESARVIDAMGRETIFLGRTGAGSVMKLAVNSLIHGLNQTLAEAMALAGAAGIAPEAAFDVIENSAAAAPMLSYRRPLYLDEAANEVTFTVSLAAKDMGLTAALAERLGVAMPQGRVTLDKLREAERAGYAGRDMAAMLAFMREET